MSSAAKRLEHVKDALSAPKTIGTLKLGELTYAVPEARDSTRLPHTTDLLETDDKFNLTNLHFLLQKYRLGQDVFLLGQPGPYARRLAMTFCRLINSEYEYIALHRDVGETELKQGREIRRGGNLVYVDSPAVRAVKHGRILIIEGIEKAERGIMPVINNLLENREMNLDDGTHILHPARHTLLRESPEYDSLSSSKTFISAHPDFRVIAIGAPVPPYKGYPLDPPFRSRFQARFVDTLGSLLSLCRSIENQYSIPSNSASSSLTQKLRDIILAVQYANDSRNPLENTGGSSLPPFPQTALRKLHLLASQFPASSSLPPEQLARLMLAIHPALIHVAFQGWASLTRQIEDVGLGQLGSPSSAGLEDGTGFLGYKAVRIERISELRARVTFECLASSNTVVHEVAAGPKEFRPFPLEAEEGLLFSNRFMGLLTCFLQLHALGSDISYVPPVLPSTASSSTSLLVRIFAQILGYELETVHLYKELGGREIVMRRKIEEGGATTWEPSPLIQGAWEGRLVHLAGLDVIGPTAGSIARLVQDRELDLWEGRRIAAKATPEELASEDITVAHPSFRIISSASKSLPLKDWLFDEHANMFFTIPSQPMEEDEESSLLLGTGCPPATVKILLNFATKYRQTMSSDTVQKNRKLGTRSLIRIARRLAQFPWDDDLYPIFSRAVLLDFLPPAERTNVVTIMEESGIKQRIILYNPPPVIRSDGIIFFPEASDPYDRTKSVHIPLFDPSQDREGAASHIPHMEHFYDNSLQSGLMRDMAVDLELLKEHLVLLGNQGVGKNKIIDRLCQLLGRPREYVQLHRDTTVNQLMFQTSLEASQIRYIDSPLLRAIIYGRVIIVDEADKAPEHVVAVLRSLGGHGEMSLPDGRRVRPKKERENDITVHPNFRMILLANRPGYPFLGNHFLQVLGDNFSCHSVSNPDLESERRLLAQLAPELDEDTLRRLVGAFHDLRTGYDEGKLSYPYSLRELINLVRHMRTYTSDTLDATLRNVFDFDVYKPETIDVLSDILEHHGLKVQNVGLDAVRDPAEKKVMEVKFEPTGSTELDEPKKGIDDPENKPHTGGNTFSGGTGGRDTAGQGGRGGFMRLSKGHPINQVSQKLKDDVPEEVKKRAREMAQAELARKLQELSMSTGDAKGYGRLLSAVQSHIASLHDLLENLAAKEEERVWVKRQTDGELDDSRLTDGLTGEATVYKRRAMEKPELGRPQIKPKRIRFLFDVSGSMYRFQYDGRLQRSLETAVMLMETFSKLSRKDKYVWDMYGHSGDSPEIALVEADKPPDNPGDRWRVAEKMNMLSQYAFSGDYTVEAIEKAVTAVSKFDGDDWFVITITDANFARYDITAEDLRHVMDRDLKVKTALICIGEGAETSWIPKNFNGRGFRVNNTGDIPTVLRNILSTMMGER
ncbi:hypothetical protein SISNIDRAFT_417941 [Sistotremastrum niveocremeum HHB9708]|uniref:ATPase dynein-related AAA domain-containing protein n=1 Tax=Sistotremastrum niveocremeum HHB9708 TaxID=1314777 RepID=A0A164PDF3_9AGAM|nr:hypothetical protein SISNIDRAFT_417941 [Sistotremastrum niveocremeum HHB9708]